MYFDEILQKAFVKADPPEEGEIILLPAGFKPSFELNMVISREDFESVLMKHRANEPASEAVLTTIGTECRNGNNTIAATQVWDMLSGRSTVLDRYTHLCNEQIAGSLGDMDAAAASEGSEPAEDPAPSFADLEAYKTSVGAEPQPEHEPSTLGDSVVLGMPEPEPEPSGLPSEQGDGLFGFGFREGAAPGATPEPAPEPAPEPESGFGFEEIGSSGFGFGEEGGEPPSMGFGELGQQPAREEPIQPSAEPVGNLGKKVDPWDVAELPGDAVADPFAQFLSGGEPVHEPNPAPEPEEAPASAGDPYAAVKAAAGQAQGVVENLAGPSDLFSTGFGRQEEQPAPETGEEPQDLNMGSPQFGMPGSFQYGDGSIPNEELKEEPPPDYSEELQEVQELFDLFFTRCKEHGVAKIIGANGSTPDSFALSLVGQFPVLATQLGASMQAHQGRYDAVVLDLVTMLRTEAELAIKKGDLDGGATFGQPIYSILYE